MSMIFQKKIDRSMEWLKRKNGEAQDNQMPAAEDGTEMKVGSKDMIIMILTALFIFIPAALLVLGLMVFIGWLLI